MRSQAARTTYMQKYRKTERGKMAIRVRAKAQSDAIAWVMHNRPDVWDGLLEAAWTELNGFRPPPGRPKEKREIPM